MRVWDTASGTVRNVVHHKYGRVLAFVESTSAQQHTTQQFLLTFSSDTLLITELLGHGGSEDIEGGAAVASFNAPQTTHFTSARCHGTTIRLWRNSGAVCVLQAPFLVETRLWDD